MVQTAHSHQWYFWVPSSVNYKFNFQTKDLKALLLLSFAVPSHRHVERAPQDLPNRRLTCLSVASFQPPGKSAEHSVSALGGSSGQGALSFGSFALGKQRK
jgi:hypothetical protein